MQTGSDILQDAQSFGGLELFANRHEISEVTAFHKFHHDEVLSGRGVSIDGENLDDVGVVERHADAAFTLKQLNRVLFCTPLTPQDFDRDDPASSRIIGAIDPTEAPRRDLIKKTVAAQEVTVPFLFEELAGLQRSQVALALHGA